MWKGGSLPGICNCSFVSSVFKVFTVYGSYITLFTWKKMFRIFSLIHIRYLSNLWHLKGFWMKVYYFPIEERKNSVNKVVGGSTFRRRDFQDIFTSIGPPFIIIIICTDLYINSKLDFSTLATWLTSCSFFLFCFVIGPLELMEASEQGGCSTPGCKGIGHFKRARHLGPQRYGVLWLMWGFLSWSDRGCYMYKIMVFMYTEEMWTNFKFGSIGIVVTMVIL